MLPRVQAAASNGERCWDAAPVRPVKPTTNTAVDDRETWITSTFRDGTTVRYWGDPEEWVDWDEFELPAQQEGGDEVVGLWDATSERAPRTGAVNAGEKLLRRAGVKMHHGLRRRAGLVQVSDVQTQLSCSIDEPAFPSRPGITPATARSVGDGRSGATRSTASMASTGPSPQ